MQSIYDRNLASWEKVCVNYLYKKKKLDAISLDEKNNVFYYNDKGYKLHSQYPEKEADILLRKINYEKDNLIMLFGIGNTAVLERLKNNLNENSKVIIYEPNVFVLKKVLSEYDMTALFESNNVALMMECEQSKIEEEIIFYVGMNWGIMLKNLHVITLGNYYIYREQIVHVVKWFIDNVKGSIKVLGNCLEDMFNGFENHYKNIDRVIKTNSINEVKDKYKGYPAIIVSAGPSLDKNIDKLHMAQDKALIIACDASLDACRKNNVKPDAIASIERDKPTYTYYYEGKKFEEDLVLVGPGLLWPQIYEEYPGKTIIMSKGNTGIEQWWSEHFDNMEFVNMGMSSATVAFGVAEQAGCNPIILIGQDLAYTNNKKHSDLTHTEFEGENDTSESDGTIVEDIYGDMIPTDEIYNLFRFWFELRKNVNPKLNIVDATEGGAKIKGSIIMTLEEAIQKYCNKKLPKHLYDCLCNIVKEEKDFLNIYQDVICSAEEIIKLLEKVEKVSKEHTELLEKLFAKLPEQEEERKLRKIVQQMQKGNEIVQLIQENEQIETYYQQIIKQTVIKVKSLGNDLTIENVKLNLALQYNLMRMIVDSTGLVKKEYGDLIKHIMKKYKTLSGKEYIRNDGRNR